MSTNSELSSMEGGIREYEIKDEIIRTITITGREIVMIFPIISKKRGKRKKNEASRFF